MKTKKTLLREYTQMVNNKLQLMYPIFHYASLIQKNRYFLHRDLYDDERKEGSFNFTNTTLMSEEPINLDQFI